MSGTARPSVYLGSFVVGEVPPPLEYQFLDADGAAINLTGFTVVTFQWAELVQGQFVNPITETGTVSDAATGRVTYVWDGDEFDAPGEHAGIFYVNNGTVQYASLLITWDVCLAIGTPPVV
jgi:hypothetical protein